MSVILNTTTTEAEARFSRVIIEPATGAYRLERRWPHIHAAYADTLIAALKAVASYTNPKADNETHTGTFVNSVVKPEAMSDTRQIDIIQVLTEVTAIANVAALAAADSRLIDGREVLNIFGFEEGIEDTLGYVWENLNPSARSVLDGITDASYESTFALASEQFLARKFEVLDDGTARFTLALKKDTWANISGSTPDRVPDTWTVIRHGNYDPQTPAAGSQRTQTEIAEGIPTASVEEVLNNTQPTDATWALNELRVVERDAGRSDLFRDQVKYRGVGDYIEVNWVSAYGKQNEAQGLLWVNLTEANADIQVAAAKTSPATAPSPPAGHVLQSVRKVDNGNGTFDVLRVTFIPKSTTTVWLTSTKTSTITYYQFRRMPHPSTGLPVNHYRAITITKEDRQVVGLDDAQDHIDGGVAIGPYQTQYRAVGQNKYIAVKYTVSTPFPAWVADTNPA